MPPRGRGGNFRGRGGRGRGRGGRGGKATSRFGPNRRFDGTRLAENDEYGSRYDRLLGNSLTYGRSESSGSESGSAPEDTVMEDIDSEDDDDEHATSSKPYMALLQSFSNENSAPDAKRRKLNHGNSTQSQPEEDSSGEDEDTEKDIDHAEDEAEEEFEENLEGEEDSEDEENPTDPFDVHFAHPDDDTVSQKVKSVQKNDWATKRALLPNMRATILHPGSDTGSEIPKPIAGLEGLQLKQKLRETSSLKIGDFDALQRNLGPLIFNYNDVLFCDRTVRNSDPLRELACLHALNHVFK